MTVHIPAGTQLLVSGPAIVEITPQIAPTPVPMKTPMQVPSPSPNTVPVATPPMAPGMTVTGFQPTYESWGGYAPVPQYYGESHRPAPLFPTYETTEGFAPVAPDQSKGMGPLGQKGISDKKLAHYNAPFIDPEPVMTEKQIEAAKKALAGKKDGPAKQVAEATLAVEEAKVKAKAAQEDAEADGDTIVRRLYSALGLEYAADDGEGAMANATIPR